jgi:hypothetical protein
MTIPNRVPKSLVILAADILCSRVKSVLATIDAHRAPSDDDIDSMRDAVRVYTDSRIDGEMTESMDILLSTHSVESALRQCDIEANEFDRVMQQIEQRFEEDAPDTARIAANAK